MPYLLPKAVLIFGVTSSSAAFGYGIYDLHRKVGSVEDHLVQNGLAPMSVTSGKDDYLWKSRWSDYMASNMKSSVIDSSPHKNGYEKLKDGCMLLLKSLNRDEEVRLASRWCVRHPA